MRPRIHIIIAILLLISSSSIGQAILLTTPSGGERWAAYTTQRITWTSVNVDLIKIEFSFDSGRNWMTIVDNFTAIAGYFDWQIPPKSSDSCFIRISDVSNPSIFSSNYSRKPFIIPKQLIELDELPLSEYGGNAVTVTWNISGIKTVNLYLSLDNGGSFNLVASNVKGNQGLCNIILPREQSDHCFLRITDAENELIADTSNEAFQIKRMPDFDVAKFKGGSYDGHASITNKPDVLRILQPTAKDRKSVV